MIAYQYQILRYRPDQVSGEFANVGIVMYSKEQRFLMCKVIPHIGRVHQMFPNVHSRPFISSLKHISDLLNTIGTRIKNELDLHFKHSLEQITGTVLTPDDSSVYFTEVNTGIDLSLDNAFEDLFIRMVRTETNKEESIHSDHDVWQKIYNPYFEKLNITNQFRKTTIKTAHTEFELDHTAKNGQLHILESVAFNLSHQKSIKDKILKYSGLLQEIGTSGEKTKIHLLTKLPDDVELKNLVIKMLTRDSGTSKMDIITEDQAGVFAEKLAKEIAE
ncbi:MAG: DUF3037 domain-containing protein [Saprospiraceae bacterium]